MMAKRIALTGATGFVGRAVVNRLLEESNVELRCLVRPGRGSTPLASLGPRVALVEGDVTEPATLAPLVDGAWGVIHLAGTRDFWNDRRDDYYALNERGAAYVFEAALEAGCEKVVQVSTPLAFGMPTERPFDETSPPGPHASDYARSKYRGDQIGWRLHRERGLPLTIVHLAAVIGGGDEKPTMEVRRAARGMLPVLVGADKTFTYLYRGDAAEAIVRALLSPKSVGRSYLIGVERATTREYFEMISELAGARPPSWNVPEAVALPLARLLGRVSRWAGVRPPVAPDVIATSAAGSLLFRADRSVEELGLRYTPLRFALDEAVKDALGPA